jgi:hypothetical protein
MLAGPRHLDPPILLRVNGKRVFVPAVVSIDDTRFAALRIKR